MKEYNSKKVNTSPVGQSESEGADVDAVMKKYDRESNIRIWTGKYKIAIRGILTAFSLWCIYVTLFATFLEEIRLTSFLGLIVRESKLYRTEEEANAIVKQHKEANKRR